MKFLRFLVLSLALSAVLSACKTQKSTTTDTVKKIDKPPFVPPPAPYQPSNTKLNDLLHTKLKVSFDWEKQYLYGKAELTFKPYFYPQNTLILDAKGMDLNAVEIIKEDQNEALEYTYDSLEIVISLDQTYTREDTFKIYIDYTAKPNELAAGGSEAINEDKGLYFINPMGEDSTKPRQIWTQGETEASSCWFPTIDSPNEKTTEEIYITVDSTFITVSNGSLIYSLENADGTRTDYWKQDKQHAPYLFMMAVGDFAVIKDSWKNREVNYLVEHEYAPYAQQIFGNTPEMIEFFSNKLGYEYPWDKYYQIVVRDFVSGAMENTSAAVFMEGLNLNARELKDTDWDYIIAHELFHHWFGDLVTCESWSNLPLNESFANYSEYLWFEYKYGPDRADYHAENELQEYINESRTKQESLIRYHYLDKEDMFDRHSYNKGGRVLHMLRNYVGDDAFFSSLNLYLNKNEYTDVEAHELRLAFEDVTGEDLNWFFNQWFFSPGHPTITVTKEFKSDSLWVTVKQLQDSVYTPIFEIPTQVAIWKDGNRILKDIKVEKAEQTFLFAGYDSSSTDLVLFDPDQVILGEVTQQMSTDEYVFQYNNEKKYLSRYNAVLGLSSTPYSDQSLEYNPVLNNEDVFNTLLSAINDPFWNVQEMAMLGLSKYNGERMTEIYTEVEVLAKSAEDTKVRSSAIEFLAMKDSIAPEYINVFEAGIPDSSYLVAASSLNAFLTYSENDSLKSIYIEQNIGENQGDIAIGLAEYFFDHDDSTHYSWFYDKYSKLERRDKIDFTKIYSQYSLSSDSTNLNKTIDQFYKDGISEEDIYTRFSGYLGLWYMPENEVAAEYRKQIVEKETHPVLTRAYKAREKALLNK